MAKIPYTKPALAYINQLQQLKSRGLHIENDAKALHLLENISYYRLSGYWFPLLQDKQNHIFKSNATFDTAFQLYCFDRELRRLILSELEKIEVAVRAKMIYVLSHQYGPFWFQNVSLFKNPTSHSDCLNKISKEFSRSDEEFILAFKNKYQDPFPPSWMLMEIISFGTLSMLYKNLKPSQYKRAIAHYFGIDDSTFESWLHAIVYMRNVCAHHTRLWNRTMSIQPRIPKKPRRQWLSHHPTYNNRAFFMLSIIIYLLNIVNPHHSFKNKLFNLFNKYPIVDLKALGFPTYWQSEPLWL
ncbi:MAG: Abi family protein [Saprospiraceae bacterium]